MSDSTLILFSLLAVSAVSGNDLLTVATGVLLVLHLADWVDVLRYLEDHSVELGIIFLVIGLMLPFATGRLTLAETMGGLVRPAGLISLLIGAAAAYLGGEGLNFLRLQPEALVGIIVGSVLGVYFLGGIPTGPLVAAGLAALLYRMVRG